MQSPLRTAARTAVKKRITIKDIAKRLNLSHQAVSAALNPGNSTTKVSPETAALIRETAESMHYRRSVGARIIREHQVRQIGLIGENLSARHAPQLKMTTILGLQHSLAQHKLTLSIMQDNVAGAVPERVPYYIQTLTHDGFVYNSHSPEQDAIYLEYFRKYRVPWVVLDGPPGNHNNVAHDHFSAAKMLTEHLLGLGHRRILYLRYATKQFAAQFRYQGYCAAMKEAGAEPLSMLWTVEYSIERFERDHYPTFPENTIHLLDSMSTYEPTAVLASHDSFAWSANQILQLHGYRIPEDISIAGINDLPNTDFCFPPLTTVRLDYFDLGHQAGEALVRRIAQPTRSLVVPALEPKLIVRQSTAAPRTGQRLAPPRLSALPTG